MSGRWQLGLATLAIVAAALVWRAWPRAASEPAPPPSLKTDAPRAAASERSRPLAEALPAPPRGSVPTTNGAEPARGEDQDEAGQVAELRALLQSDPARCLALAREANRRSPGSEHAPERAWLIVRSLVNLQRFDEAREEAVVMVDTYRDTPWALDVERHLLTQPLRDPSQRGFAGEP